MNNPTPEWTPAKVQGSQSSSASSDMQLDLGALFSLLWRKKWVIALCALVMALLSIAYVQNSTKLYGASATLILESSEENVTGLESLVGGISDDAAEMNSQIEVIRSRKIIGQVVDKLGLHQDEEFVPDLRTKSWFRENYIAARKALFALLSPANDGTGTRPDQPPRETAIDNLIRKLNVGVIFNTHVFEIKLETKSPKKSALIVNTLAESFIGEGIAGRLESTSQAALWLGDKVNELGEKLADAEAAAAEYRSNTERNVTKEDVAASNINLKNARGRLSSFETNLAAATGSPIPRTDRDLSRYALLKEDIGQLEAIVTKQTQDLLKLNQLEREAVAAGTIYQHFATRLNEIEVQKGLQESDVRMLSRAIPRYNPTKPKKFVTIVLGTMLGLLLGTAYVILRRVMDRSFNDPAALQQQFGIPVVGTIPKAPGNNRRSLLTYAMKRPASALMEAVRDMRTSLMLSGQGSTEEGSRNGTVLVMTSSIPSEGKTTSSILLAVNSAALKKKVLLIECDLRRSTFQSYFGRPTKFGLVEAIDGNEGWEQAIWTEPQTGADIVFGGGKSQGRNAADIFASNDFANFIALMRARYDLVILDSPPVLPVPDARLIAKLSDKIVYVVRSGTTPASTVAAGLRLFENIGIKVDGLNLTQMRRGSGGYGYGYGYGYSGYHQGGSKYYQN